ncbi:MAG: RDD family protein [Gammaproteobacteria bacterium]|jgi:uncharacterized RDD family membrane protein YckC
MTDIDPYATPDAELADDTLTGRALASRGARMLGAGVDALIGGVIAFLVYVVSGYWDDVLANDLSYAEMLGFSVLGFVTFFLVHGYALAHRGQTLGKMVAGTQIVDYQTDELLPLRKLAAQRYLPIVAVASIPFVGNLLAVVNVLFIFRRDRRCVHDHIAGSKVVVYLRP